MKNKENIWHQKARSLHYFFHRQIWHLVALLILLPIVWAFASPVMGEGSWLGIRDITWFWLTIGTAVLHQILVWIVFRLQLGWATLSKIFGSFDLFIWSLIFLPFLLARVITLIGLAKSDSSSLFLPELIALALTFFLLIPAIYTIWSVLRYFGIIRALGADHFRVSYRKMPLVKKGIFKWNNNSMYSFAFFLLWVVALFLGSQAALSAALFQHVYIWVHYFCTEKPDMEIIYSK